MRRFAALAFLALLLVAGACRTESRPLRLATTTSVDNSGLLDVLLPAFTKQTGIRVEAVSVGSGKALQLARRGDADMTLTHDPNLERVFLAERRAVVYRKIMFDDFMIVGPPADPAAVAGAPSAVEAMRRIAVSGAPFASRGDDSGTEAREKLLWAQAGASPTKGRRLEAGQAMAPTLSLASESAAYCLTDRPTFTQLEDKLALRIMFQGGPDLLNSYAIMVVRGTAGSVQAHAEQFVAWLTGDSGRQCISDFRIKGVPAYTVWPIGVPGYTPEALPRQAP